MDDQNYTKVFGEHYQHVDNGGLTISVTGEVEHGELVTSVLEVTDGYYGYSSHTLKFREVKPAHLRKFAEVLSKSADEIERLHRSFNEKHLAKAEV